MGLRGSSTGKAVKLTVEQALYLRMRGQNLLPQFSRLTQADATKQIAALTGGLQAQDLFAATLGVRVRAEGSTLAGFEGSRIEARSVVWTWLMRGTLHLVAAEDIDWLLAVFGPPTVAATARRRGEIGLTAEVRRDGLRVMLDLLGAHGPATREELGQALADAGLPNGYSIERYLFFCAALEGHICCGPDRGDAPGTHPTFTLLSDWLGRPLARLDEAEVRAGRERLVRRYLDAFAPANLVDFSAWAGLNVRDVRAAWDAVSGELVEVEFGGRSGFVPTARMDELREPLPFPVVRLLPAFDTYILGHKSRELIDDGRYAGTLRGGGMLPAAILVDGRIEGTWRTNRKGRRTAVTLDPFSPLSPEVMTAAEGEVADIERFVGAD